MSKPTRTEKRLISIFENLENGNLTDARNLSKPIPHGDLVEFATDVGWSAQKTIYAADFLKRGDHWQEYCDSK